MCGSNDASPLVHVVFVHPCTSKQMCETQCMMDGNIATLCAPIYQLDLDVLGYIFWMNTDTDPAVQLAAGERRQNPMLLPLNVLRSCSQVCHQWRQLACGSSTLWGRVIQLDLLVQKEAYWRDCVMLRTGDAPLHITGVVDGRVDACRLFLLDLLRRQWSRIHEFDVQISHHAKFDGDTWRVLQRPSPVLEVFKVVPRCWDDYIFLALEETTGHLFADSAPSLREFTFPEAPELYFSLQSPWMRHLSTLVLFGGFSSTDMIDALANMGNHLEYLELKEGFMKPLVQPRQCVSLPRLRRLSVTNRLQTCTFLLHHIIPAPGCSLFLSTHRNTHIYRNISPKDISDLSTQISRYADNFLSVHDTFIDTLRLGYNSRSFSFKLSHGHAPLATGSFLTPGRRERPEFSVNVIAGFRLPRQTSRTFLDAMKMSPRTIIVTFDYTPSKVDPMDEDNPPPTIVLPYLSSMTTLVTSEYGFEMLLLDETNTSRLPYLMEDIFPSLHTFTLKFNGPLESRPIFKIYILSFLKARIMAGRPLPTIDVSAFESESLSIRSHGREKKDWKYLEDIPGLKVKLRHRCAVSGAAANCGDEGEREDFYVCGSGAPHRLVS